MSAMASQSPASRLFIQAFIQALVKENIKAPRHWPLWGEFTGDRWIPHTKGQKRRKCFHLMTSSWNAPIWFRFDVNEIRSLFRNIWLETVYLWDRQGFTECVIKGQSELRRPETIECLYTVWINTMNSLLGNVLGRQDQKTVRNEQNLTVS